MCQHKPTDLSFLFFLIAFDLLRNTDKSGKPYRSLHSVWSGFNTALEEYFPGRSAVTEMDRLMREGLVWIMPAKGGVNLQPRRELPLTPEESRTAEPMRTFLQAFKERRTPKVEKGTERERLLTQAAAALTVAGQLAAGERLIELFGKKPPRKQ